MDIALIKFHLSNWKRWRAAFLVSCSTIAVLGFILWFSISNSDSSSGYTYGTMHGLHSRETRLGTKPVLELILDDGSRIYTSQNGAYYERGKRVKLEEFTSDKTGAKKYRIVRTHEKL